MVSYWLDFDHIRTCSAFYVVYTFLKVFRNSGLWNIRIESIGQVAAELYFSTTDKDRCITWSLCDTHSRNLYQTNAPDELNTTHSKLERYRTFSKSGIPHFYVSFPDPFSGVTACSTERLLCVSHGIHREHSSGIGFVCACAIGTEFCSDLFCDQKKRVQQRLSQHSLCEYFITLNF